MSVTGGRGIQVGDRNYQVNIAIGDRPGRPVVFAPEERLPEEYPPSSLLRGDYEIVPFTGRTAELRSRSSWVPSRTRPPAAATASRAPASPSD
ncbi:hypothetical protein F8568_032245 [Actinomadura sp. LD22]|uniref:Uncharacterized protein n=1 Tax=Actinomadura physcomitrii TaxID=2650748 RepID=A0A6I4MRN0_9ACTN|nr:hypothetical protein [Actinomadura physcomitrii]MWA04956.1 hypothetical protein [Actinomadura physcomitrii]